VQGWAVRRLDTERSSSENEQMHPITVGCCGWSYKDWNGVFYPDKMPAGEYLSYYAQHYNIVEVDSSFYASPGPQMVRGWHNKTPDHFRFSLKVPRTITHEKLLVNTEKEVDLFLSSARLLEEKLFCCCLQFAYLNSKCFKDLDAFLLRLDAFLSAWPQDVAIAVEIRNKNWFIPKFADCLRSHKAAWVIADQAWTPPPLKLVEKLDVITGPFGYFRLLGDRKAVDDLTSTLDHVVIDRMAQIESDAQAIRRVSERVPVMAYVNNHYEGFAQETVARLLQALEKAQR
jgi:uncharacterized protein YecE (DUF72 family)